MANSCYTVPVDRGWAWIVLAGCVLEITVYGGIMRSFGIFFIQFQQRFQSNTYETALMGMIQNATLSICSVFVMTIGLQRFSSRVSVFTGGVLTVTGFLLTAFTTDLAMFYFAQGFLLGFGMSLIHAPELAILGIYFKKHKALANGIFTGGASIGGLVFAPIIVALFREYQFTGAMLIITGLLMHICVGGLLLRPPEFYTRKKTLIGGATIEAFDADFEVNRDITIIVPCDDSGETYKQFCKETNNLQEERTMLSHSVEFVTSPDSKECRDDLKNALYRHLLSGRARASSVGSKVQKAQPCFGRTTNVKYASLEHGKLKTVLSAISKSQGALCERSSGFYGSSLLDITNPEINRNKVKYVEQNDPVSKVDSFPSFRMRIASILVTIFDLNLMRDPVFLVFLLLTFTSMTGHTIVPNFIPTHANEVHISNENIGALIAVLAAVSLFSRIFIGIVVDRMWLKWSTAIALMSLITGTACHLLRFVNDFPALMIFVVVVGFSCGQYHSLYAVILLDIIGPAKFKSSLGFGTLVHGASSAVFFPIIGYLRDYYGSYIAPYHLLGGLAYFSAILVLLMPKLKSWQDSRRPCTGS